MSKKKCYAILKYAPNTYDIVCEAKSFFSLRFILRLCHREIPIEKLTFVRGRLKNDWFEKGSKFYDYRQFLALSDSVPSPNGKKPKAQQYKSPQHRHRLLKQHASGEYGITREELLGLYDYGSYCKISKSWKDQSKRKHQWDC